MHPSSLNSPNVSPHPTPGLLLPSVLLDLLPATLKTSGNALTAADWSCFKSLRNKYHNLILAAKKHYYSNLVCSSSHNPKRLWQTVNNLLHRISSSPLPSSAPGVSLADSFASFFTDKISKLSLSLASNPTTTSPHLPSPSVGLTPLQPLLSSCQAREVISSLRLFLLLLLLPLAFSTFTPTSESEIHKILSSCPNKNLIPIPFPNGF